MAASIEWTVKQLECHPQHDGKSNVVFAVYWSCRAVDGSCVGEACGTYKVTYAPDRTFTNYEDLSEDMVLGWMKSAFGPTGIAAIETAVLDQVESQKNPTVVSPPLPWIA